MGKSEPLWLPHTLGKTPNLESEHSSAYPVDNFGTVVGENPTPYGDQIVFGEKEIPLTYLKKHLWSN